MKSYTYSSNNKELIIFFAGWGADEKPFKHLTSNKYDVVIFYDYIKINTDEDNILLNRLFSEYTKVHILAWSMGVWGACVATDKLKDILDFGKISSCTAINGTLTPVNNSWGIPIDVYDKTINNLPQGLSKFNLRMCGKKEIYEKYFSCQPQRDTHELKEELIAIKQQQSFSNSIIWNKAIISLNDNIFPSNNMLEFWNIYQKERNKALALMQIEQAHFPFFAWNTWDEIIDL